jgi:hypothetical protein
MDIVPTLPVVEQQAQMMKQVSGSFIGQDYVPQMSLGEQGQVLGAAQEALIALRHSLFGFQNVGGADAFASAQQSFLQNPQEVLPAPARRGDDIVCQLISVRKQLHRHPLVYGLANPLYYPEIRQAGMPLEDRQHGQRFRLERLLHRMLHRFVQKRGLKCEYQMAFELMEEVRVAQKSLIYDFRLVLVYIVEYENQFPGSHRRNSLLAAAN